MTAAEIAEALGMPLSTVSGILRRLGLGRLGRIGLEQPIRTSGHGRASWSMSTWRSSVASNGGAGKRVFGDSRRRSHASYTDLDGHRRGAKGWEYVHVAVDDYSRLAYAEVLGDETAITAAAFLQRAITHFGRYGITVERVLTDNGSCYRSVVHAVACRTLGIRHIRTRSYRPQTNGKAERFIRTLIAGWAYGAIYRSSHERTAALDGWLWHYNHRRRHSALGHQPPVSRTNLLGSYS
jgi:transposase InsO family protein